jgi:uncharacterized protein (TIGR02186 family)
MLCGNVTAAQSQPPIIADLEPYLIKVTTGFAGTDLLMFGTTDGPGDVILVVRGPIRNLAVRRKQQIAGIWVNADKVTFGDVPTFYAATSSRPLNEILPESALDSQQIGVERLHLGTVKAERETDIDEFRAALIRNKQRQGLFAPDVAKVTFLEQRLFRAKVHFPDNVPTGNYAIDFLLVRDGEIVSAQGRTLSISKIGIGADIFEFAHEESVAYGLLAIFGALMAGWVAHLVFRTI